MKKENILFPFSIVILGGCIVLSAWMITNGIETNKHIEQSLTTNSPKKALMTSEEAAHYMGISLNDFDLLIENQDKQKAGLQAFNPYKFIPYIIIGIDKFFNETEINKWIEYNMLNK
ncbi:MAG: hypothetical protein ACQEXQ_29915 [Bacillota bacterium]